MLEGNIYPSLALTTKQINRMFELYSQSYVFVTRDQFTFDLNEKDYVILLTHEDSQELCGFSTQKVLHLQVQNTRVKGLFSGDTVIDRSFWGEQALARTFLSLAGKISREDPEVPLYWFLISKGYRTYLYLPLFFNDYFPRYDLKTPQNAQEILDGLAFLKFPEYYNATTGLLEFSQSKGNLTPDLCEIPLSRKNDPRVKFFIERNPKYCLGTELCCLTQLSESNIKPFARKWFESGKSADATPINVLSHV